ncbi:MAG TPA: hypothetical protein QF753_15195 [Victivallales bacterium]|nr:hypothetical protein [Victivallales bacterium]
MKSNQVAVFNGPKVNSTVTGNLKSQKAKGGILCHLSNIPEEPASNAVLKNGEWTEVSHSGTTPNAGSSFSIDLDGSDNATSTLISNLRNKKTIDELVVYELDNTSNKEQFGYYFSKIFVNGASSGVSTDGSKIVRLACSCVSFKQKDKSNNEPVLWDWNTNTHVYTGSSK